MKLYYGMWSILLMMPMALRFMIEILCLFLIFILIWPVIKWLSVMLWNVIKLINLLVWGGARKLLQVFPSDSDTVYMWDEKFGILGQRIGEKIDYRIERTKQMTRKKVFSNKRIWLFLIIVYFLSIMPVFKLEKFFDSFYLKPLYGVNRLFLQTEEVLTEGIEDYPDLIKKKEAVKVEKSVVATPSPTPAVECVTLFLKEDVSMANVRKQADIDSSSIGVVTKEDRIIYQNENEYDGERFWLKVTVETQENLTGFISMKVIRQDIVESLNLQ